MMKRILSCLLMVLPVLIMSCSDDDNPAKNGGSNILPVTSGSYWIYEGYELDANYNRVNKNPGYDSTLISGTTTKLGKEAAVMATWSQNIQGKYTKAFDNFYYNDNGKLFVHSDYIKSLLGTLSMFISYDEKWYKIADENDEDWTVTEQDVKTLFDTLQIKMLIRGKKAGQAALAVKGSEYTAREYDLDVELNITMKGTSVGINYKAKVLLWFVNGIGLVKSIIDMPEFSIPGYFTNPASVTESYLYNYVIK